MKTEMEAKRCHRCAVTKELSEFEINERTGKHRSKCKKCVDYLRKKEQITPVVSKKFVFHPLLQQFVDKYAKHANLGSVRTIAGHRFSRVFFDHEEEMQMIWARPVEKVCRNRFGNPMIHEPRML